MLFNPDPRKQAIKTCFSHKGNNENYPWLVVNGTRVQLTNSLKYLGIILCSKLDFNEHKDNKTNKYNKIIGIIKRLSLILSRKSLLKIYKFSKSAILSPQDAPMMFPFNVPRRILKILFDHSTDVQIWRYGNILIWFSRDIVGGWFGISPWVFWDMH